MKAYKLFRVLKSGEITPLFINKKTRLPIDAWMQAEKHHDESARGFKYRPFWHCTSEPIAPHLSMKNRAWYEIEMEDYQDMQRPKNQGGLWYLANRIKIIKKV
jgi:hypothetical protein